MAYIRTLNQADWFFNPGKTPGGLEPTGAAAPPLPGAPGAAPPPATTATAPAPAASEPEEAETDETPSPSAKSAPPVLERKKSTPFGLYLLGGVALAVIGVILYKKFGGDDDAVVAEAQEPEPAVTASEAAPLVAVSRKKKRK